MIKCIAIDDEPLALRQIKSYIERTEQLKSTAEANASHLADRLVPYTLAGTGLVWAITRNTTKALAVLMVDFSCALKLAMPLAVLSAMREASGYHITVKGGKYPETVAQADTIVFDKTGTLTQDEIILEKYIFPHQPSDPLPQYKTISQ